MNLEALKRSQECLEKAAYASLIQQCGSSGGLSEARRLHAEVARSGLDRRAFYGNLLAKMYGQCGSIQDARQCFARIRRPNVVSGNIMLAALARNGHLQEAKGFFDEMPVRNVISWTTVLSSYSQNRHFVEATNVFDKMPGRNVISWNAMITAFTQSGHTDQAAEIFNTMPENDLASWNAMIQAFVSAFQVEFAQKIYSRMPATDVVSSTAMITAYAQNGQMEAAELIFNSMLEHNVISCNAMMHGFFHCGCLADAEDFFMNKMPRRSVSSWNGLIQAYAENGHLETAQRVFDNMPQHDSVSWMLILAAHAEFGSLEDLEVLSKKMPEPSSVALSNVLVQAYARNGYIEDAEIIFFSMLVKDAVSWTAMISGYAQNGYIDRAEQLFDETPCRDIVCWTAMITGYAHSACMEDAERFFHRMPCWDVVAWNAMIAAHAETDEDLEAARMVFDAMPERNSSSWNVTIQSCINRDLFEDARMFFDRLPKRDAFIWNVMIQAYVDAGHVEEARNLFSEMPLPDTASWTTIIRAHTEKWPAREILKHLCRIDLDGIEIDHILYTAVLEACANQRAIREGKLVHAELTAVDIDNQLADDEDDVVEAALISMYAKCGCLDEARSVFDISQQKLNVALWSSMISGYSHIGLRTAAMELFHQMLLEGIKPNAATYTTMLDVCGVLSATALGKAIHSSLVDLGLHTQSVAGSALVSMYSKWACIEEARQAFENVVKKNVVVWTSMISGYAQNGHGELALRQFAAMDMEGIRPDVVTFISAVDACAGISCITHAKLLHNEITCSGFECHPQLANALLNLYSKCGCVEQARNVFENLAGAGVVSSSTMITAYAQIGNGSQTLSFFREMQLQGIHPEAITFLSVISACSHAGLVQEGVELFQSMKADYSQVEETSEHYACMVDLLARSGKLEEAEDLICSMPFEPHALAWMALLAACKSYGHVERGRRAATRALELDPTRSAAPYVLLSNIQTGRS